MRLASMVRGVKGLLDKLSSRRLTRGMPKTTKMDIDDHNVGVANHGSCWV